DHHFANISGLVKAAQTLSIGALNVRSIISFFFSLAAHHAGFHEERAAILDDAVHALLPALWLHEVGNTVARRFPTHASGWLSAMMKFGLEEALPSPPWFAKTLELTSRLFPVLGRAVFASIAYATTQSGDFHPVARPPEV